MEAIGKWIVDHREIAKPALAAYFMLAGMYGFRSLITGAKTQHEEFAEQSRAYKFGVYFRECLFCTLDFTVGLLILFRVSWVKVLGIALLAASTPYSARGFAWGFASGRPSTGMFLLSLAGFCAWNGFLIYLMVKAL